MQFIFIFFFFNTLVSILIIFSEIFIVKVSKA